jgi:hypothetical protein
VAAAVPAAVAALPFLVIPTNSQSGTVDLGDGLRARVRPGQRTVEIERKADDGLFGTGIGVHWETLPVDAQLHVGEDGATSLMIDNQQLENAVGPDAAAHAWEAIGSAMARPRKPKEDDDRPPAGIGYNSGNVPDQGGQNPEPGNDGKPSVWPEIARSVAERAADAFERPKEPPPITEAEAKRVEQIRQVMKAHGQEAPSGHYQGDDGFDTKAGVRMHPKLPDPAAGRDYVPENEYHRRGYVGELELPNRIQTLMPDEVVIRYGNAAGVHGPDAISVGPDGDPIFWESKYRTDPQSTGPRHAPAKTVTSFEEALYSAEKEITKAVRAGRLDPDVGARALENVENRQITIATVGTGNAHGGLVEFVRGRTRFTPRRQ